MEDDVVAEHPFAIMLPLDKDFGYTVPFLDGSLPWDSTAVSGGGRHSDDDIKDLAAALADLTRQEADMESRELTLATLFHHHYDQKRVVFLVQFLLDGKEKITPSMSKTAAVGLLVKHHAPFIPFPILNKHLVDGANVTSLLRRSK
jgi:hypothetical protein